jgi:hypothetical protein
MKFALRNLNAPSTSASQASFDSLEEARTALRDALGWSEIYLGPGYTTPNAAGQVWCAYRTRAEAEADPDGLGLPRVVRVEP